MGQYYKPLLIGKDGKIKVYDTYLDNRYIMAKLCEQSWWDNAFVNTICQKIFRNPMKVAWVGDYSDYGDESGDGKGFPYYKEAYGDKDGNGSLASDDLTESQVLLKHKYLVNHDKKEYINCDEFFKACKVEDEDLSCMHPLPLLTCAGNGRGGGDYDTDDEETMKYVGSWCLDTISIEMASPDILGFKEIPMDESYKKNLP